MSAATRKRMADPEYKARWKAAVAAARQKNPKHPRRQSRYFAAGAEGQAFRDRWSAVMGEIFWTNGVIAEPKRAKAPARAGRSAA